jgi:small-conductance mechanosensitive channel
MFGDILQKTFFQNRILDYLIFLVIFLAGLVAVKIFRQIILKRLKLWAEKTATQIDDLLIELAKSTLIPLLYFGAFYLGSRFLNLHPAVSKVIDIVGLVLLTIYGVRFLLAIINYALEVYLLQGKKDAAKERSLKGMLVVAKVIVWGLAIVLLLDNLGFKISTVIAGLGIGGVAIALAAQAILGDLFSYFSILFDRPFEIGDFIIIGEYLGTIEHIGIKTTRIRSLGGEQLVFSNTDLTNSRVRNYKRMDKRRVVFKLGVTYPTKLEKLKEIPGIIKNVINSVKDTVFDRAHFSSYGDFNLVFEVVYYVMSRDYNKYMDIQQEINFKIKEEFEKRKIEFAYPTQTLYVSKA